MSLITALFFIYCNRGEKASSFLPFFPFFSLLLFFVLCSPSLDLHSVPCTLFSFFNFSAIFTIYFLFVAHFPFYLRFRCGCFRSPFHPQPLPCILPNLLPWSIQLRQMDNMFAVIYPDHSSNMLHPFDLPPSAPSPTFPSTTPSSMDLTNPSDPDPFQTPSPAQLMPSPSPLDVTATDNDAFHQQVFEAILSPTHLTPVHSTPTPTPESLFTQALSQPPSLFDALTSSDLASDLTMLDVTTAPVAVSDVTSMRPDTTVIDKERVTPAATEKKTSSAPKPNMNKRHSVSRQAHQPPLVTHQYHTPPPFVSPLLQQQHHSHPIHQQQLLQQQQHPQQRSAHPSFSHSHSHHHHHHKTGSLVLSRTGLKQFFQQPQAQPQKQQQQQNGMVAHGHLATAGLINLPVQGISSLATILASPTQLPTKEQLEQDHLLMEESSQASQLQQQEPSLDHDQLFPLQHLSLHSNGGATLGSGGPQRTQSSLKRRLTKDKLSKHDREEVWPPDVETVFYEGKL